MTTQEAKTSTKDEMLEIIKERIGKKCEYFQGQYTTKETAQSYFNDVRALMELADFIRYG